MFKEIISVNDVITSGNTYPERAKSSELTQQVIDNITELLKRVNLALSDLGIKEAKVSSGFRPSSVNNKVSNAAKRSSHMSGEALDILDDKNQSLCKLFTKDILEKYDLYREDSDYTVGKFTNWCHLQTRKTGSGNRIFKP